MSTPRLPGTQPRWTQDEDELLVSLFEHSDLTIREIARKMSRAKGTVQRKLMILRKEKRVGTRAVGSRRWQASEEVTPTMQLATTKEDVS